MRSPRRSLAQFRAQSEVKALIPTSKSRRTRFHRGRIRVFVSKLRIVGFGLNFNAAIASYSSILAATTSNYKACALLALRANASVDVTIVISETETGVVANAKRKNKFCTRGDRERCSLRCANSNGVRVGTITKGVDWTLVRYNCELPKLAENVDLSIIAAVRRCSRIPAGNVSGLLAAGFLTSATSSAELRVTKSRDGTVLPYLATPEHKSHARRRWLIDLPRR